MVNTQPLSTAEPPFVDEWADLERHAIEPNIYLSPHFAVPAAKHLAPSPALVLLTVRVDGRLAVLGLFQHAAASWRMPRGHLRAYGLPYALQSGLLVHREFAREGLAGLLRWMATGRHAPPALEFEEWRTEGPVARLLGDVRSGYGLAWCAFQRRERAVLMRAECSGDALASLGSRRRKSLRRAMRDLEEKGPVRWELLRGSQVTPAAVDRFLTLEAMGWKGGDGTALLSKPQDTRFFRAVVDGLATENRVFFCELWCGDHIVASNSNFIAGDMGFAFKVGWNPEFRAQSPGILNELRFMEQFAARMPDITSIDGGAQPGSFIDALWTGRDALEWGFLVSGAFLTRYSRLLAAARQARHALRLRASRDERAPPEGGGAADRRDGSDQG
jgi:hypothetical protein